MRFPHLEIPSTYQDDPGIGSVCSFQSVLQAVFQQLRQTM